MSKIPTINNNKFFFNFFFLYQYNSFWKKNSWQERISLILLLIKINKIFSMELWYGGKLTNTFS